MANSAFRDVAGNLYQAAVAQQPEDALVPFASTAFIASLPLPKVFTPYYNPQTVGLRSGDGPGNGVIANPAQVGINNSFGPGRVQNGLSFEANSVVGSNGFSGQAPVINLARGHEINWWNAGNSGEGFKSVTLTSFRSSEASGALNVYFQEDSVDILRDAAKAFRIGLPVGGINYPKLSPGTAGNPAILSVEAGETNAGLGLLPLGTSAVTATRLFVGPQSFWSAMQSGNLTRPRTQFIVGTSSFTNVAGEDFYPQMAISAGRQSGSVTSGSRSWYNTMTVDTDNIAVVGGPQGLSMLYIGLGIGESSGAAGSTASGGRNGLDANIFINSDLDVGPGSIFHVAVAGNTTSFRKMGGVPGGFRGNIFGGLLAARAHYIGGGVGARYLNSIVGLEIDVEQEPYATALWKIGLQVVEEKDSAENATQQNVGIAITNQASATTIGFEQLISFSSFNGQYPGTPNGQMITTLPSSADAVSTYLAADGINLNRMVFSRALLSSEGMLVDGSGNIGGKTTAGNSLQTMSGIKAAVSSVASVVVLEPGSYDGSAAPAFPTFNLTAPPIVGVTATLTVTSMKAVDFMGVSNAGTLYTAGTVLTQDVASSGAGTPFTIIVDTVGSSGQPVNIRLVNPGNYTTLPANPVTFTGGGAGTLFSLNMRWGVLTSSTTAGTNYNEFVPPEALLNVGLMRKEARFRFTMAAGTQVPLVLNAGLDRAVALTGQVSAAGAAGGTLLNSPVAGNPTHWQKVSINGANYAIPCWPG